MSNTIKSLARELRVELQDELDDGVLIEPIIAYYMDRWSKAENEKLLQEIVVYFDRVCSCGPFTCSRCIWEDKTRARAALEPREPAPALAKSDTLKLDRLAAGLLEREPAQTEGK